MGWLNLEEEIAEEFAAPERVYVVSPQPLSSNKKLSAPQKVRKRELEKARYHREKEQRRFKAGGPPPPPKHKPKWYSISLGRTYSKVIRRYGKWCQKYLPPNTAVVKDAGATTVPQPDR